MGRTRGGAYADEAMNLLKKPVLLTSIPPLLRSGANGDGATQTQAVISSFQGNGYDVVSLKRGGESQHSQDLGTIRHATGADSGIFKGRYGPSFGDIFRHARSEPIEAIVNSDTYMVPSNIAVFMRASAQTVVVSRRIEVDTLGKGFNGVYNRGIDAVFVSQDIDLSAFENDDFGAFQLGASFWDIVIPLVLSFHFKLLFASPPILLHPSHPLNWRQDDYHELRRYAVLITVGYARKVEGKSPRAAQFLRGLALYCPGLGRSPSDRQVKRAATYMAAFLEILEMENGVDLSADMNHPYMRACLNSMASIDRDHINAARLFSRYYSSDYSSTGVAWYVLRTMLRMRRVIRRRRQLLHLTGQPTPLALGEVSKVGFASSPEPPRKRPLIRIRLKHTLWTPNQYSPRLVESRRTSVRLAAGHEAQIAIVTPSFNQAQFLGKTIDSVLSQDMEGLRYHVQDGGSVDGSVPLLEAVTGPISYESAPDQGQGHAINLGFQAVSGDIMAYLNSDDILLPGSLAYVGDFFDRNPEIDFLYSHRIFIDEQGRDIGRAVLPPHDAEALKWADYIPQETMFWRRRVWEKIGPFDDTLFFAMDWDFILRAAGAGFRFARVPCFLGAFRIHLQQKTSSSIHIGEAEMMLLRERYLGFRPTQAQVDDAVQPYLNRQAVYAFLGRHGILRY